MKNYVYYNTYKDIKYINIFKNIIMQIENYRKLLCYIRNAAFICSFTNDRNCMFGQNKNKMYAHFKKV